MRIKLTCPLAVYGDGMKVLCTKTGQPCAHQYYKRCKGWWTLTEQAERCPVRLKARGENNA